MMLRKSTVEEIAGTVALVKASISLGKPGTAAESIFLGPIALRISARRRG